MATEQRHDQRTSESVTPAESPKNTVICLSNAGYSPMHQGSPRQTFAGIRVAFKDDSTSSLTSRRDSKRPEPRRIIAQPDEVLEVVFESPVLAHRQGFEHSPEPSLFGSEYTTHAAASEVSISSANYQLPNNQVVISLECQVGQLRVSDSYYESTEQTTVETFQAFSSSDCNNISHLASPGQSSNLRAQDTATTSRHRYSESFKQTMMDNFQQIMTTLSKSRAMQEQFSDGQSIITDLQRQSLERQDIIHNTQRQMQGEQKELLEMGKQTLDRLSIIQSSVQAVLTQTFELLEYPIPRLFIILPKETRRRNRYNPLSESFRLYFLCECGTHTMDRPSRSPHTIHLAKHEGYDIEKPTEFLEKYGKYIMTVLQMIRLGVATASTVVPALAMANVAGPLELMENGLLLLNENLDSLVEDAISMLESKANSWASAFDVPEDQSIYDKVEGLEGADLRQLESFLSNHDTDRTLGNLYRMVTNEGHVKWVCQDHYRANYKESFRHRLSEVVEENRGFYSEQEGKISITLMTSHLAKQFYEVMGKTKGIHELDIRLGWDACRSDLRHLQNAVRMSNISILRLHSSSFESPYHDVLNRSRRFDPILEIMSNGRLQSFTLVNCRELFKRISHFPNNTHISNLRHLHLEECFEPSPDQIRRLLESSPKLKTFRVTQHTLEATLVRLDTGPTSPGRGTNGPQYHLTAFMTHSYSPKILAMLRSIYVGINITHLSLTDSQCSLRNLNDIIANNPNLRTMNILSGFLTPLVIAQIVTSALQSHYNHFETLFISGEEFYDRLTIEYHTGGKVMRILSMEDKDKMHTPFTSLYDIRYELAIAQTGARLEDPFGRCDSIQLDNRMADVLLELIQVFPKPVHLGVTFEDFLHPKSLMAAKRITKRFASHFSKMVVYIVEINTWWPGIQEIASGREAFPRLVQFSVRHSPRLEMGVETMMEDCGELLLDWLVTMLPIVGSEKMRAPQLSVRFEGLKLSRSGWGRLLGPIALLEFQSVGLSDAELELLERVVPKDTDLELIFKMALESCTHDRVVGFRKAFRDGKTRVLSRRLTQ
ncbi:hypothetical protein BGW38_009941 [Lunasporangiospora selenospora]|uniref:Uncharacterized protein n=1 Tax=Lunasporangiospora selenospora TaxID=979761 RepID=A0A9P6FX43_9FUNG|nr:hypothetical protein BGW38_009941 [Lunasporangiospora selenospora]